MRSNIDNILESLDALPDLRISGSRYSSPCTCIPEVYSLSPLRPSSQFTVMVAPLHRCIHSIRLLPSYSAPTNCSLQARSTTSIAISLSLRFAHKGKRTMASNASAPPAYQKRPRRFAPLNPERRVSNGDGSAPELKGVVFDVDGTLWYVFIFLSFYI